MILCSGIAGFIGSNFVKHVLKKNKNEKIIGIDDFTYAGNIENLKSLFNDDRFLMIKGDITNRAFINKIFGKYQIDTVINFAAESHVDRSIRNPQVFINTNIIGTHILLEEAKSKWAHVDMEKNIDKNKFIQISTDEVYGSLGVEGMFSEQTPLDPHSPYSASKASADLIVKSYFDTYGMPINITRCSNNYGPFQFPEKLIPLIICNALNHKSLPIYGDGNQIRDWLFVEDHCEAILSVMEYGIVGEIYNIGGNNERTNIEIVRILIDKLRDKTNDMDISEDLITHVEDRLGHDRRYAIDSSKIQRDLDWRPNIDFSEGMDKTVNWYLHNKDWLSNIFNKEYMNIEKYDNISNFHLK